MSETPTVNFVLQHVLTIVAGYTGYHFKLIDGSAIRGDVKTETFPSHPPREYRHCMIETQRFTISGGILGMVARDIRLSIAFETDAGGEHISLAPSGRYSVVVNFIITKDVDGSEFGLNRRLVFQGPHFYRMD